MGRRKRRLNIKDYFNVRFRQVELQQMAARQAEFQPGTEGAAREWLAALRLQRGHTSFSPFLRKDKPRRPKDRPDACGEDVVDQCPRPLRRTASIITLFVKKAENRADQEIS